jgi:hypothetical protein
LALLENGSQRPTTSLISPRGDARL